MAFVVVDGNTVPVALGGGSLAIHPVGDRHRAFDGTMRDSITDNLRVWTVKSAPMSRSDADSLYSSLTATSQPKTCSGDLLGASISCYTKFVRWTSSPASTEDRVVVEFTLEEAS